MKMYRSSAPTFIDNLLDLEVINSLLRLQTSNWSHKYHPFILNLFFCFLYCTYFIVVWASLLVKWVSFKDY